MANRTGTLEIITSESRLKQNPADPGILLALSDPNDPLVAATNALIGAGINGGLISVTGNFGPLGSMSVFFMTAFSQVGAPLSLTLDRAAFPASSAAKKPAAKKPATKKLAAKKPATKKLATKKPATKKLATKKPAAR